MSLPVEFWTDEDEEEVDLDDLAWRRGEKTGTWSSASGTGAAPVKDTGCVLASSQGTSDLKVLTSVLKQTRLLHKEDDPCPDDASCEDVICWSEELSLVMLVSTGDPLVASTDLTSYTGASSWPEIRRMRNLNWSAI